jgi:hypothetical protein
MPTRYLKPGIRDSELIEQLTPAAETLFYRLIVTVDDFGRADARPAMIKAHCFPIKDQVDANDCAVMLTELADVGLVAVYVVEGKPYLQMQKWDNNPRAKESKFPAPADGCMQVHADADGVRIQVRADVCNPRTVLPVTVTGTGTGTDNREPEPGSAVARKRATRRCPNDFELTDTMREWAVENAPAVDVDVATAKFRDHTFKTAITDWQATWRNWMRKDQEFAQARAPKTNGHAPAESFKERDARLARERYEAFAGITSGQQADVIDVEPHYLGIES